MFRLIAWAADVAVLVLTLMGASRVMTELMRAFLILSQSQ